MSHPEVQALLSNGLKAISSTLIKSVAIQSDLALDLGVSYTALSRESFAIILMIGEVISSMSFGTSEMDSTEQEKLIDDLLDTWKPIFRDKRIMNWLEKNNYLQYEWAWNNLIKFDERLPTEVWEPTNENELKAAIIALFDILHDQPDCKTLLIGNMKRAWSQEKFPDKNEGKKAYSISMTEKTKKKLDLLAEQKGGRLNETVEALIREEFKRLNG